MDLIDASFCLLKVGMILEKVNNESFIGFESCNSSMKRNGFEGKINMDVDFNPERLDGVFGMAFKTIRKSIRIPIRIHRSRRY